jgi:hypothetical protein
VQDVVTIAALGGIRFGISGMKERTNYFKVQLTRWLEELRAIGNMVPGLKAADDNLPRPSIGLYDSNAMSACAFATVRTSDQKTASP